MGTMATCVQITAPGIKPKATNLTKVRFLAKTKLFSGFKTYIIPSANAKNKKFS